MTCAITPPIIFLLVTGFITGPNPEDKDLILHRICLSLHHTTISGFLVGGDCALAISDRTIWAAHWLPRVQFHYSPHLLCHSTGKLLVTGVHHLVSPEPVMIWRCHISYLLETHHFLCVLSDSRHPFFSFIPHLVFCSRINWILDCSPYGYLVHSSEKKRSGVPTINWCWSIYILRRFPIYIPFLSIPQIMPNDLCTVWLHSHIILFLGSRLDPQPPPSESAYRISCWEG